MPAAQRTINEIQRLETLRDLQILDSFPESDYDDITKLAASICGTPIAGVSLVDKNRQWFKSIIGVNLIETPLEHSFSAHAILTPHQPLIIEDATQDGRFLDNPLVTGPPHIRLYAGYPLVSSNIALGMLSVLDVTPRKLSDEQIHGLKILSQLVVRLFELRKAKITNTETVKRLEERNQALDDFTYFASQSLTTPLTSMKSTVDAFSEFLTKEPLPLSDLHTIRRKLKEKINGMHELIQDFLTYSSIDSHPQPTSKTSVNDIIENLTQSIEIPLGFELTLAPELAKIKLNQQPIALVFQHLISNAIKHHRKDNGKISIDVKFEPEHYEFCIADDGPGIAPNFHDKIFMLCHRLNPNPEIEGNGIGLSICRKIVSKNGGKISLTSEVGRGSTFTFTWPKENNPA